MSRQITRERQSHTTLHPCGLDARGTHDCTCEGEMPRYFFSIQAADEEVRAEYSAELTDDAAALAYACEIVRKRLRSVRMSSAARL